jgi:hypothetical protein
MALSQGEHGCAAERSPSPPLPRGSRVHNADPQEYNVRVASRYYKGPELLVDMQVLGRQGRV